MSTIGRKHFTLGIMGGMGPAASNYFQSVIVRKKAASSDQENMPMNCHTNTDIPDRTERLLDISKSSPVTEMMNSIKVFEQLSMLPFMGVPYVVMPCNTAHAFREELQTKTKIAILDMVRDTVDYVAQMQTQDPNLKVGLLATNGTCATKIYHNKFKQQGITLFNPDDISQQECVQAAIYGDTSQKGIKGNEFGKSAIILGDAIDVMKKENNVNAVILGCTELPLVREALEKRFPKIKFIDPMEVVAQKAIDIHEKALEIVNNSPSTSKAIKDNPLDLKTVNDYAHYIVSQALQKRS